MESWSATRGCMRVLYLFRWHLGSTKRRTGEGVAVVGLNGTIRRNAGTGQKSNEGINFGTFESDRR